MSLSAIFINITTRNMGAICRAGTAYPSWAPDFTPVFNGVHIARSLVFCEIFCRTLFVLLSFFFRPLCCLSLFNSQFLITPLVSSNSSYLRRKDTTDIVYWEVMQPRTRRRCLETITFEVGIVAQAHFSGIKTGDQKSMTFATRRRKLLQCFTKMLSTKSYSEMYVAYVFNTSKGLCKIFIIIFY